MGVDKIKQAFILGAGLGTRLRPLTDTVPKVMVPIAPGKPLLEYTIERLKAQGIGRFVINLHYLPDVITSHFGNGEKFGVHIEYSDETQKLFETAGAIKKAEPLLDDNFIFMYGDEMTMFDFRPLMALHEEHGAVASVVLRKPHEDSSDLLSDSDLAEYDPASRKITAWHERPHDITELTDRIFLNAGLYVLSKKITALIPPETPIKLDGEVMPRLVASGAPVYGFPTEEKIFDIGKPEKYELAKEYYSAVTAGRQ